MKTLDLVSAGKLNLITRRGFPAKLFLAEVPQAGRSYALVVKNDADTPVMTVTGVPQSDRVLFQSLEVVLPSGVYRYTVIVTNADTTKRAALSGSFTVQP